MTHSTLLSKASSKPMESGLKKYLTDVPPGHDTVWGFLANHEPAVLGLMFNPVLSLFEDQQRAVLIATNLKANYIVVTSPPIVAAFGTPEVLAFPIPILRECFPTNP